MQTTLNIQDSLWHQASKLANIHNESDLVTLALSEFIQNHDSDYLSDVKQALSESQQDLKQGGYTKNDIDSHVAEMFEI